MAIDVLMGAARLDDETGIETFLNETPNPDALRPILKPGEKRRIEHYGKNERTARYLLLDGEWFVCFVATDITLGQARTSPVRPTCWSTGRSPSSERLPGER